MNSIKEVNLARTNAIPMHGSVLGIKISGKRWESMRNFANIVCSRESFYRTGLDITAFDIPVMGAALFRNWKNFLEAALECCMGTISVSTAPYITTFVGRIAAKFILPKDMRKDTMHYLQFTMNESRDGNLDEGIRRIQKEEPEDKEFIASLYRGENNKKTADEFRKQAKEIEDFCKQFKSSEKTRELIYKLKKTTMIGESFIEGGWWGAAGLLIRGFRKYVLHEDRFTGTKSYIDDSESAQIGEAGELNWFQKIIGAGCIFLSPIMNAFMYKKMEGSTKGQDSKFFKIAKDQLDMTHGIYPKLGLLFSYTTVPKWISSIALSQGWFERSERILKLLTVVSSWWLGHRITNGTFAKKADKKLSEKYQVEGGILIEPQDLIINKNDSLLNKVNKFFPEPAKIHHVIHATSPNKQLQAEAENKHAECLYNGFILHSAMVWIMNMIVNQITKLRALHALNK